jgi:hypothetical protein
MLLKQDDVFTKIEKETKRTIEDITDCCQDFWFGIAMLGLLTLLISMVLMVTYSVSRIVIPNCDDSKFVCSDVSVLTSTFGIPIAVGLIIAGLCYVPICIKKCVEYKYRDQIEQYYREKSQI